MCSSRAASVKKVSPQQTRGAPSREAAATARRASGGADTTVVEGVVAGIVEEVAVGTTEATVVEEVAVGWVEEWEGIGAVEV